MKVISLLLLLTNTCFIHAEEKNSDDFNKNWDFQISANSTLVDQIKTCKAWEQVTIPHDWSVHLPFDSIQGEGCTGYLLGGTGWYRKHFEWTGSENELAYLYFDGVYNHSEYWLNGHKLGYQAYGYAPFYFDITPYLKDENELVVKVNRSRTADSRWYTGSGIYREVQLISKNKVDLPVWGCFITTPEVSRSKAQVNFQLDLSNRFNEARTIDLVMTIKDQNKKVVKTISQKSINLQPGQKQVKLTTFLTNPQLWSVDHPHIYELEVELKSKGEVISSLSENFGIRSIRFDPSLGFFLNGESVKIKGVCLHHDAGSVGAAVPKEVWARRFKTLKDMGCNAIRISHNPGSEEFLDLCDEYGFLVQDEFFDEWDYPKDKRLNCWEQHDDYSSRGVSEYFAQTAEMNLKNTVLAHRNHPSIIQWSIGNEIEWTYASNRPATGFFDNMNWNGNYFWSPPPFSPEKIKTEYEKLAANEIHIEETAKKLSEWTKSLDTTRPVIANCILPSVSFVNGYADQLDVVGFSYRRIMYDYAHKYYPDKAIMGTECLPQWHEWKAAMDKPYVAGVFLWTGFDHMGEVNASWPSKSSPVGLIDQAGFPKQGFHMYKSLWTEEPYIYMSTQLKDSMDYLMQPAGNVLDPIPEKWDEKVWHWPIRNEHWNYQDGEKVLVEVISNCEKVELFQNGLSLGVKKLADFPDRKYKWFVDFKEGEIKAKGYHQSGLVDTSLKTLDPPAKLKVMPDRTTLKEGEVAHVIIQLCDKANNEIKHANANVFFEIGGLANLGVDNGYYRNVQTYQANNITTHAGHALLIVKASDVKGKQALKFTAKGLEPIELTITVE